MIQVVPKHGQLFVCALGCCCGHTEDGFAPVPVELYHSEWERRKLRNTILMGRTNRLLLNRRFNSRQIPPLE